MRLTEVELIHVDGGGASFLRGTPLFQKKERIIRVPGKAIQSMAHQTGQNERGTNYEKTSTREKDDVLQRKDEEK